MITISDSLFTCKLKVQNPELITDEGSLIGIGNSVSDNGGLLIVGL